MAEEPELAGRDEPPRGPEDHAELLSQLDTDELALLSNPRPPPPGSRRARRPSWT